MTKKFSDTDLMQFADKETKGKKAMEILVALLKGDDEAKELAKRLDVFMSTRTALINNIIEDTKWKL